MDTSKVVQFLCTKAAIVKALLYKITDSIVHVSYAFDDHKLRVRVFSLLSEEGISLCDALTRDLKQMLPDYEVICESFAITWPNYQAYDLTTLEHNVMARNNQIDE